MRYYGTLGPACADPVVLEAMIRAGMTGCRLNLSHGGLRKYGHWLQLLRQAEQNTGRQMELLIDLQGPELRIGTLKSEITLQENDEILLGNGGIPVPEIVLETLKGDQTILVDDGALQLQALRPAEGGWLCRVTRGGMLRSRKSLALEGEMPHLPTLTEEDLDNLSLAAELGVNSVMLPFVRDAEDLRTLRQALKDAGAAHIEIFAKIENPAGVAALPQLLDEADHIVIARGDLGSNLPLHQLPAVQKRIAAQCRAAGKPFMVVTQLLHSMEHSAVPTRAEVSDIFNAVLDGAASLMLTGETAAGMYPVQAMQYLIATAQQALEFLKTE